MNLLQHIYRLIHKRPNITMVTINISEINYIPIAQCCCPNLSIREMYWIEEQYKFRKDINYCKIIKASHRCKHNHTCI